MTKSSHTSDGAMSMTLPATTVFAPDVTEAGLRAWYRQPAHTVRLGMIESVDAKAAGPNGSSRSLNGPADLRILRTLRSQADVVVVGGQTARSERYGSITLPEPLRHARTEQGLAPQVHLAIVTRSGDIPAGLNPVTTWIITTSGSPATRLGAPWHERIIEAGLDEVDPRTVVTELAARGLSRVLCEGGPGVARRLLSHGIVHDYCLTTSPRTGGAAAPPTPPVPNGFALAHELVGGGFTIRRWQRPE